MKDRRRRRSVPCAPYGTAADYVPFYFAPRSPMMFRIACDHRDQVAGRYADGDDPLVYLVSSVDRVAAANLAWVATDGNCANAVSRFATAPQDLDQLVDWPLMKADRWDDVPDDRDRMRRRMAELLVHRSIPVGALAGFAVRTEARATEVQRLLTAQDRPHHYVGVRPDWYYGYGRRG